MALSLNKIKKRGNQQANWEKPQNIDRKSNHEGEVPLKNNRQREELNIEMRSKIFSSKPWSSLDQRSLKPLSIDVKSKKVVNDSNKEEFFEKRNSSIFYAKRPGAFSLWCEVLGLGSRGI